MRGVIEKTMTNTITGERRIHSPEFKFKAVLEAIMNDNMPEVARRHSIAHSLLAKWKRFLLTNGWQVFVTTPDKEKEELQQRIAKLEQMVGKKEVELALIKNFSDFYASRSTP